MNHIKLYVHTDEQKTGAWALTTCMAFASMDSSWMLDDRVPEENDIIPWQQVALPSGELLYIGAVFDDPAKSIALHIKSTTQPILEIQTKGHPCLRFLTPEGADVSIQIHEDA